MSKGDMPSFADEMANHLRSAGLIASEISSASEGSQFENADAVFSFGCLLLRLVRDRGQIFLEIAASSAPRKFYQFDDVAIAMGWKSIEEVLSKQQPEEIDQVLFQIDQYRVELETAFSNQQAPFTLKRIDRVAQMRGAAFVEQLRTAAAERNKRDDTEKGPE